MHFVITRSFTCSFDLDLWHSYGFISLGWVFERSIDGLHLDALEDTLFFIYFLMLWVLSHKCFGEFSFLCGEGTWSFGICFCGIMGVMGRFAVIVI